MTRKYPSTQYSFNPQSSAVIDLTEDERTRKIKYEAQTIPAEALAYLTIEDDEDGEGLGDPVPIGFDEDAEEGDVNDLRELTPGEVGDLKSRAVPGPRSDRMKSVMSTAGLIEIGMAVELSNGEYLYIKQLTRLYVQGILLRRTRWMNGMLPKKCNELCAILKTHNSASDPSIDGCLVVRDLKDVVTVRQLTFTNQPFPKLRYDKDQQDSLFPQCFYELGPLVCRWKRIDVCDNSNKVKVQALVKLQQGECTPGAGVPQHVLRCDWTGKSAASIIQVVATTSGEGKGKKRVRADVDLTEDTFDMEDRTTFVTEKIRRVHGNKVYTSHTTTTQTEHTERYIEFTYGDICTGAGGTARGAEQAGLKLRFVLDQWEDACQTLEMNWPAVDILQMDIFDFLTTTQHLDLRVDILHISFPCQPHSPAHTQPGSKDEENIAAGYSVIPILQKCKPRVVTFEQTSGIVTHNGGYHFRALLQQLTMMDYNVRSGIVRCDEYGNVQPRKRLIVIASCPGETLPKFPEPTHGPNASRPLVTVHDRLRLLRNHPTDQHMQQFSLKDSAPYDAKKPLPHCITTDGGASNEHPDGGRSFSLQELAVLQAFPPEHRFYPKGVTSTRRQIGNAEPACLAKARFKEIIKTMKETDRVLAEKEREVISID